MDFLTISRPPGFERFAWSGAWIARISFWNNHLVDVTLSDGIFAHCSGPPFLLATHRLESFDHMAVRLYEREELHTTVKAQKIQQKISWERRTDMNLSFRKNDLLSGVFISSDSLFLVKIHCRMVFQTAFVGYSSVPLGSSISIVYISPMYSGIFASE